MARLTVANEIRTNEEVAQVRAAVAAASSGSIVGPTGPTGATGPAGATGATGPMPSPAVDVTGSRGGNAALANLLTALATLGLITDSTT